MTIAAAMAAAVRGRRISENGDGMGR